MSRRGAVVLALIVLCGSAANASEPKRRNLFIQPAGILLTGVFAFAATDFRCPPGDMNCYDSGLVVALPVGFQFVDSAEHQWIVEATPSLTRYEYWDVDYTTTLRIRRDTIRLAVTGGRQWRVDAAPAFFVTTKVLTMVGVYSTGQYTMPTGMVGLGADVGFDHSFGELYVALVVGGGVGVAYAELYNGLPGALSGDISDRPRLGLRPALELNANLFRIGVSF